ncbi:MAG: class I SAM-dependent RNA methyltransferase [Lachnospiraceae bacterium]|nr:class I SAM-dependent RNA methyltransferase [Lachnospiraceae bacterium]
MEKYRLMAPCHFGMEAVLKKEIIKLGYEITEVMDGRVIFAGGAEAVARANVFLRTAERVLLIVGDFTATSFEELFEGIKRIDWPAYIPENGKFWVTKAASVKSKLFSPSDIQSIVKKAMVERMKEKYRTDWFSEDGDSYPLRIFINKDRVLVGLDSTGESLHKRGYRKLVSHAPLAENLAAGLIMLTPWKADRILVDPFCGCGTIPIEAALMAANIAPGMNREFTAENWGIIPKKAWYEAIDEANDLIDMSVETDIQGYDIDDDMIKSARENAAAAGVENLIHFQRRPVAQLSHPKKYGFLVTNPPYGERIGEKDEITDIYKELADRFAALDSWSAFVITGYADAEKYMGRKADKNRKIYNGMMKTYYYEFDGPKPASRPKTGAGGSQNVRA